MTTRSLWAWGTVDRFPDDDARRRLAGAARMLTGGAAPALLPLPRDEDARVPAAGVAAPAALAAIASADPRDRAAHAYGRGYPDLVRGFHGDFAGAPDVVLRPRDAGELAAILDWCADARVAAVPYGGGTSVVGGVELPVAARAGWAGVASIDLGALAGVHEVDHASGAARIGAGTLGPDVEAGLAADGLTLRHFPQSFAHSTLGGWIATRAGGHYATGPTHIDDFVEAMTVVTPRGVVATRRLPASGAGPDPHRLWLGSEGALGVITEAWMRVTARPRHRARASIKFARWDDAVAAARALARSGLSPANCRLLDPAECLLHQVSLDGQSVLLVAFESADHPLAPWMARALELARDHRGTVASGPTYEDRDLGGDREGLDASWKKAFIDAPYLQSALVSIGIMADTFETACTWAAFPAAHAAITAAAQDALRRTVGGGLVACRFTHVYPDGPAPYYTFLGPARANDELAAWREVKAAVSDALAAAGCTITHHHAVGRLHRPWYDRERPPLFADALRAAKRALDPAGVLNPGVLVDT
jgi:alkyldihydroxyacetonephosphate synthase